jgi:L-ascorbate metabolism protein UlaG (beta-lactamase superfamily)
MFKTLFFIILTLIFHSVHAKVEARWMTVASLLLDDGKTKILFDPAWTRPDLKHWLGMSPFKSDEALVAEILKSKASGKIDAVFVSHSHFDHSVDAPMVSKLTGAVFYTDKSTQRIAESYNDPKIRTIRMLKEKEIRVGEFVITPLPRVHSPLLHLFDFLPGHVPKKTTLGLWDYHVGSTWFFLIKHPEGTILVDQGSESNLEILKKYTTTVDALVQGIANRKSDEVIMNGYLKTYSPKVFIPVHFDNFFADFNEGKESFLPGIKIDELVGKLKKAYPMIKSDKPVYGEPISLLEIKR